MITNASGKRSMERKQTCTPLQLDAAPRAGKFRGNSPEMKNLMNHQRKTQFDRMSLGGAGYNPKHLEAQY